MVGIGGLTIRLPATAGKKVGATAAMEKLLAATAPTARRKIRSALASFRRLSPSRTVRMRWGARNWRSTAVAATASGGATTAPERNRLCPWHRRYERVSNEGDGGGRESNREYNQAGHRRPIISDISERRIVSRIKEHGCDEERQRKLRGTLNEGAPGRNASSAPPSARNTG